MTFKSDVGVLSYKDPAHPHAVTSVGSGSSGDDAVGNQITRPGGVLVTYTPFDEIKAGAGSQVARYLNHEEPPPGPKEKEDARQAGEVGAAAPPTDVDTTGSSPEHDPQAATTAPDDWRQNPYVQIEGGFLAGVSLGLVPMGGVGQQLADAGELLPHGTPEARFPSPSALTGTTSANARGRSSDRAQRRSARSGDRTPSKPSRSRLTGARVPPVAFAFPGGLGRPRRPGPRGGGSWAPA
jgi:hypothetical protein